MRFNHAFLSPLLDGFRISPLSQQQTQGSEYDTLACTCLASDDREALIEFDIQLINQSEVLDI